jgi:putative transposase
MPQSLAKVLVHLVFSTKQRERVLTNDIREELHRYIAGILKNYESPAILINSVEDHLHILFSQSRNHSLADLAEQAKKGSSKWLKTKGPDFARFHWQNGYGAFSVSQSNVKQVTAYIQRQPEHHKRQSFQDEFLAFLKRHEIEYDERYVWD